ncbi:CBN-PHY-4 protein [Aphelenchoides avenae]|nr:CBN-PHY-4 protein [Aphelenchus avenae]
MEFGDLILWFNADSNDARETDSLHAACPIEEGEKIAVSLWIRGNFQDGLKCSTSHPGYIPLELLRSGHVNDKPAENRMKRPMIPEEIAGVPEDYEDWDYDEYEEGEEGVEEEATA